MKAAPEDRLETRGGGSGFPLRTVLLIAVIVGVGGLLWKLQQEAPPVPATEIVEEAVVAPVTLPPAADIPQRPEPISVVEAEEAVETPPPPLPTLEDSDPLMREQLSAAGAGPELEEIDAQQNLIQLGSALVDGFSRGVVLYKLLPVKPPAEAFSVEQEDEQVFMAPASYRRYDEYAEAIATLDTAVLVNSFHQMRPLYEQAYGQLGLPPEDFDNAVIRLLDRVLETPELEQPIALTRKSVMYKYADPQLEQLTPMQKQLLRMGPENIRRIKEQAQALRAGLLGQP